MIYCFYFNYEFLFIESLLQNRNNCIIDRLSYLCLNETLADVYFLVGGGSESSATEESANKSRDSSKSSPHCNDSDEPAENINSIFCTSERIPAHKLILSIGSQVFMVSSTI